MDIAVGDTIQTRKKHPCGASSFEVLRVGMDFKIRCTVCQDCFPKWRLSATGLKNFPSA